MPRPLRIIVADSDPSMRGFYRDSLTRLGHDVVGTAATGPELLDMCAWSNPDMLITEVHLAVLDGIEVSTRATEHRPMPVILVTSRFTSDELERARKNHVMAYLVKPIKQVDLEAAIAVALTRFGQITADQVPPPPMHC